MQEENEIHYLAEEFERKTVQATAGKRFANLIIDNIVITIVTYGIDAVLLNLQVTSYEEQFIGILYDYLIFAILIFAMEALLKGKSIGKFITKTRAVNESDGNPINARTALLRSLVRIVPFEAFSALGTPSYPWHDKWTGSIVVEE